MVVTSSLSLSAQCLSFLSLPEGQAADIAANEGIVAFTGAKYDPRQEQPPTGLAGYVFRDRVQQWLLPIPSQPQGIALASADSMWITDIQFGALHRVSGDGGFASFSVGQGSLPYRVAVGPDDAVWFTTHSGFLGHLTTTGQLVKYPIGPIAFDLGFDAAGTLWVAEDRRLLRFDPVTTMQQSFPAQEHSRIYRLAFAADGSIWFTDRSSTQVGRFDPATSTFRYFRLPESLWNMIPGGIAKGPDDRMWFMAYGGARPSAIGAIDQGGVTTFWLLPPDTFVESIASDGHNVMWFTAGTAIGRFQLNCRRRPVRR